MLELFAYAEEGDDVVVEGGAHFLADELAGLAEESAALGVADDDHGGEFAEHGGRDFAGEGAGGGGVEVLGAEADAGVAEAGGEDGEGEEGRKYGDVDVTDGGDAGGDGLAQGEGLVDGIVHFPVTGDELSSRQVAPLYEEENRADDGEWRGG